MNKLILIYSLFFLNILQIETATITIVDENCSEPKYLNEYYINSYKVPQSLIIQRSNGKSLQDHPINNAFDFNFDSYWQSVNYFFFND